MSVDPISLNLSAVHGTPTTMASPPPTPALNGTLAGISSSLGMEMAAVQSALKAGASITSLANQQGISRSGLVQSVQTQIQATRQQAGQSPLEQPVLDRMVNRAFDRTQR